MESKYNYKLIKNLPKKYNIYNNNISLDEIRILICLLINCNQINDLIKIYDILICDNFILKLFLFDKNKIKI